MAEKEVAALSEQRLQEIRERCANRDSTVEDARDLLAELTRSRAALLEMEKRPLKELLPEVYARTSEALDILDPLDEGSGPNTLVALATKAMAKIAEQGAALLEVERQRDELRRVVNAIVDKWNDPDFWKDKGCTMDSTDCAEELGRELPAAPLVEREG